MAQEHDVALHTGTEGLRLNVWDEYSIELSMLSPGSPWAFTLYRSEDRSPTWKRLRQSLVFGDRIFFSIDGATQMNGYLEDIIESDDPHAGQTISISGRDLSGPALKWHADPRVRLTGLTQEDALARLFGPLGIGTRFGEDVDATRRVQMGTAHHRRVSRARRPRRSRVDYAHPRAGETVWQVADAICRRLGYMMWTAPHPEDGLSVVVDVPDYTSPVRYRLARRPDGASQPGDILRAQHHVGIREVPTEVNVYTGSGRGEAVSARSMVTVANGAFYEPTSMGGFAAGELITQPMHVRGDRARTPAAARQQALRLISDANARLRTYTCTVQGHGQPSDDGPNIYAVNTLARVVDPRYDLDEEMLILEVRFQGGVSSGAITTLTLGAKGAIHLVPELQ